MSSSPTVGASWARSPPIAATATRARQAASAAAGVGTPRQASALVGAAGFTSSAYGAVGHAPVSRALAVADTQRPLGALFRGGDPPSPPGSPVRGDHTNEVPAVHFPCAGPRAARYSPVDGTTSEGVSPGLASRLVGGNLCSTPARLAQAPAWMSGRLLAAAFLALLCLVGLWAQPTLLSGSAPQADVVLHGVARGAASWWRGWMAGEPAEAEGGDLEDEARPVYPNQYRVDSGLLINPILTSPSMYNFKSVDDRDTFPLLSKRNTRNGPVYALFEMGDKESSWCSSTMHVQARVSATNEPHDSGNPFYGVRAQLAVWLGARIFPDRVVIESPPPRSWPDPESAPVGVSLWAEVPDEAARAKVWAAVLGVPEDQVDDFRPAMDAPPARVGFWGGLWSLGLRWATSTVPEPADMALGKSWVRLGGVASAGPDWAEGRIHFRMDVDMEALGVPVSRTVLRVDSNQGAPYTCLFQAKLLGQLTEVGGPWTRGW